NSRPQPWQGCALPLSYSRKLEFYVLKNTIQKQEVDYKGVVYFVKKRIGPIFRKARMEGCMNLSADNLT
ncbi:MAG TPA: hypothetical protein PKJ85_08500, partial [Nitrosomonas nitrosa]|nr:hypothetical protein [Nitrosomonas nitrosa]